MHLDGELVLVYLSDSDRKTSNLVQLGKNLATILKLAKALIYKTFDF